MSMNPWKMNLKQINKKIEEVNEKITKEEAELKESKTQKAKAILKRGLYFLRTFKEKLLKEEQKRFDKGESLDSEQKTDDE